VALEHLSALARAPLVPAVRLAWAVVLAWAAQLRAPAVVLARAVALARVARLKVFSVQSVLASLLPWDANPALNFAPSLPCSRARSQPRPRRRAMKS
jgi:hypothetical protein